MGFNFEPTNALLERGKTGKDRKVFSYKPIHRFASDVNIKEVMKCV
jgi:hypothetical protein